VSYRLELADAYDYIKTLPDGSVDALITDPPFGVTQLSWDKANDWPTLWPLIYQKCKSSAVQVVFSCQPFTTDLINSNRKRFRYPLVWAKTMPTGFLDANRRPLRAHEDVLVFSQYPAQTVYNPQKRLGAKPYRNSSPHGSGHYNGVANDAQVRVSNGERHPTTVIEIGGTGTGDHPTAKPLELLCYLVKTYSNPGDTVLDLFTGSGTTAHACLLTGRKFVGCEIDSNFHAIAKRRLDAVMAQPALEFAS
jgi:site-specific DNA-methyltransferase (adenine-specific)